MRWHRISSGLDFEIGENGSKQNDESGDFPKSFSPFWCQRAPYQIQVWNRNRDILPMHHCEINCSFSVVRCLTGSVGVFSSVNALDWHSDWQLNWIRLSKAKYKATEKQSVVPDCHCHRSKIYSRNEMCWWTGHQPCRWQTVHQHITCHGERSFSACQSGGFPQNLHTKMSVMHISGQEFTNIQRFILQTSS